MGACSDRLQLIKFWLSCAPGKGVCGGAKIFGSALLRPARSVCVSPNAFSSNMNCDLWFHMAESLLTGLVFTFHCACGYFVSGICKLKPKRTKNYFFCWKPSFFSPGWDQVQYTTRIINVLQAIKNWLLANWQTAVLTSWWLSDSSRRNCTVQREHCTQCQVHETQFSRL